MISVSYINIRIIEKPEEQVALSLSLTVLTNVIIDAGNVKAALFQKGNTS